MSLLLFSLSSVVAQAALPGTWSKNPQDWQSKCSPEMHWCAEDHYPSKYSDGRPRCPRGSYEWLKVTSFRSGDARGAFPAQCEGEFKEDKEFYPATWNLSFRCDPAEFERRNDGDYAKVFVGYALRHYPRPSKYSKLTERYWCEPMVGAGSLQDIFP